MELTVSGNKPAERADAARNRRKILSAAAKLVADNGVAGLSMDEVAAAAGVGVGTVYRRFSDRAALIYALIDDQEREFQEAFLRGPAPLGPQAQPDSPSVAPGARIRAFIHTLAERTEAQSEMLLAAESDAPLARFTGAYAAYHRHLAILLEQLEPSLDAHYVADALLAPLAADVFVYQRRHRGMTLDRIQTGLDSMIAGLTGSAAQPASNP